MGCPLKVTSVMPELDSAEQQPDKGHAFADSSWTLRQLILGSGGVLKSIGAKTSFAGISTDSRSVKEGEVFLALSGDNYDGAQFVEDAIRKGASCIITSTLPKFPIPVSCILVQNTQKALGDLARWRRAMLPDLKVVAITGSCGKTTVKEMVACILMQSGNVLKTKGNFNNLIGMPLSLLPVTSAHNYAVLEMGMNQAGEIARLAEIANPDVACILNVHGAHLEGLGSLEGVAKAKGELFDGCDHSATLIVNLDDDRVASLGTRGQKKLTFGNRENAFVRASNIVNKGDAGISFTLHLGADTQDISINAYGLHNISNCLAAAAMSSAVGASLEDIASGLKQFRPDSKRLSVKACSNGLKVVNDSYNANPASMKAALESVSSMSIDVKAVAVLGDMLELGDFSEQAHEDLGKAVVDNKFGYLLAVGDYAGCMVTAAMEAGMSKEKAVAFANKEDLASWLSRLVADKKVGAGDYILFKGSRGMAMETLIDCIGG